MAQKNDAIAPVGTTALARPSFIDAGDHRGTENITRDDLQMPRLALAQALSPELDSTSPRYIDGLKVGEAFNSLTGEIYGKTPLEVVIVRIEKPRFIEFDESARGGIKDFDVPANDPRTQFTTNDKGETVKPVATRFMEYVALLLPSHEPIALSFKGSGIKIAKQLNGLISLAGVPSFALRFTFTPSTMRDPKSGGSYTVFAVKYAPKLPGQDKPYVTEETYKIASALYNSIKDQTLVVEREAGDVDTPLSGDSNVPF